MKNLDTPSTVETPVFETILLRRSRRAYSLQPVEPEKIHSLFEAARWAPSSVNEQPWTYLYATRKEETLWKKIFDTLSDGNKIWAKDAPLLIVSMVRRNFTRTGNVNTSAKYDLGGANAFLSLHATELGLNVHQMGGYDPTALRKNLNVLKLTNWV